MKEKAYQICKQCVMDTSDNNISFEENGICIHCREFERNVKPYILPDGIKKQRLIDIIIKIKEAGIGKKYDCILGLSGGVDSTYTAYIAMKNGLRTLLVHFDNGWDSELAIKNIENIINKTKFDYLNYVVDWEEFKDLQLSYFKASVVDVEIPTDMGIISLINKTALKKNIKYILNGVNHQTEHTMGTDWNFSKMDRSNLLAIHKKFGNNKLKTFPYYSPLEQILFKIKGIKYANLISYNECNYQVIKEIISKEFSWKDYSVKHGESIFTKFYQCYYLPKKFGFDKRRAHLSDQINSGFISRNQALKILDTPVYSNLDEENKEYLFVTKKLGLTNNEFEKFMADIPKSHYDYPVNQPYGNFLERFLLSLIKIKIITSSLTRLYQIITRLRKYLFYNYKLV